MQFRAQGRQMLISKYESYNNATKRPVVALVATADLKTFKLTMRENKNAPGSFYKFTAAEVIEFEVAVVKMKKKLAAEAQEKAAAYSFVALETQYESEDAEAEQIVNSTFEALHLLSAIDTELLTEHLNKRAAAPDSGELWLAINALTRALTRAGHPKPRRSYKTAAAPQQSLDI